MIPVVKGYRPMRQVADTLGRHGIAVLRMDDRGWGASTGDHVAATSADFADDVRAGLAYLRTRKEIDPARLVLIGHSEGGLIAPLVAAADTGVRAIVLMAGPSQDGRTILDYQMRNGITNTATLSATQRDSALRDVPRMIDSLAAQSPWMKFFFEHDPLATARQVKAPTLILQGETDRQVTAAQAEELAAALRAGGNRDVTVRLFPRANHLFLEDADGNPALYSSLRIGAVRSDVLGAMLEWLRVKMR
jgi:alpha-beta hydrolase superfamily lysophospholipase